MRIVIHGHGIPSQHPADAQPHHRHDQHRRSADQGQQERIFDHALTGLIIDKLCQNLLPHNEKTVMLIDDLAAKDNGNELVRDLYKPTRRH